MVEGVNNTNLRLEWNYDAAIHASILTVKIARKRNGIEKIIAFKSGQATVNPTSLDLADRNQDGSEYEVLDPATLVLKEVNNDEEYEYVISVVYYPSADSSRPSTALKSVFVDVKGEEEFVFYFIF